MADDIWGYADDRRAECRDLSLSEHELEFYEEYGSGGSRGQVFGTVTLGDEPLAYLSVHEVVVLEDGHAHREEYAYFLVIDGIEIWGYERDPSHDPAVHCHGRGHERYDADPISFKAAVELGWETVSDSIELGLEDLDPARPE